MDRPDLDMIERRSQCVEIALALHKHKPESTVADVLASAEKLLDWMTGPVTGSGAPTADLTRAMPPEGPFADELPFADDIAPEHRQASDFYAHRQASDFYAHRRQDSRRPGNDQGSAI